jgi:hypothetical protein
MLSATNREKHSHIIFNSFRFLTSLAIMKKEESIYLVVSESQSNVKVDEKLLIKASEHDKYIGIEKIPYYNRAVLHLNCNDYYRIFEKFEKIKSMVTIINESTLTVDEVDVDILPYDEDLLRFFNQHFENGNILTKLIKEFRKELSDIIRDSVAGAELRGHCDICK